MTTEIPVRCLSIERVRTLQLTLSLLSDQRQNSPAASQEI